jgi:hypothetical protein
MLAIHYYYFREIFKKLNYEKMIQKDIFNDDSDNIIFKGWILTCKRVFLR